MYIVGMLSAIHKCSYLLVVSSFEFFFNNSSYKWVRSGIIRYTGRDTQNGTPTGSASLSVTGPRVAF